MSYLGRLLCNIFHLLSRCFLKLIMNINTFRIRTSLQGTLSKLKQGAFNLIMIVKIPLFLDKDAPTCCVICIEFHIRLHWAAIWVAFSRIYAIEVVFTASSDGYCAESENQLCIPLESCWKWEKQKWKIAKSEQLLLELQ